MGVERVQPVTILTPAFWILLSPVNLVEAKLEHGESIVNDRKNKCFVKSQEMSLFCSSTCSSSHSIDTLGCPLQCAVDVGRAIELFVQDYSQVSK